METTVIPTLQATFDKVAHHLLTQGEQALSPAGSCKYRAGCMSCAVGCLLTDAAYRHFNDHGGDNTLEGQGIFDEDVQQALILSNAIPGAVTTQTEDQAQYIELLTKLQVLHDEYMTNVWREELIELAGRYNLSAAVPTGFPA